MTKTNIKTKPKSVPFTRKFKLNGKKHEFVYAGVVASSKKGIMDEKRNLIQGLNKFSNKYKTKVRFTNRDVKVHKIRNKNLYALYLYK